MGGELLESGGNSSAALEPSDAPLDDVSSSVLLFVEGNRRRFGLRRNDGLDAPSLEPTSNSRAVVRPVARDGLRAASTPHLHTVER
jgi:hypothetical protein